MVSRTAAIDLGTNTARLLIADCFPDGRFDQVFLARNIVRLGGGFSKQSGLSDEAMQRALDSLHQFRREMDHRGVAQVRAVATSAVRDAANGAAFVQRVHRETGIQLAVIDGELEGSLTLLGVLAGIDQKPEQLFVFDVGGGSTEYTVARAGRPVFVSSIPLGVVRLTEGKADAEAMSGKIARELDSLINELDRRGIPANTQGSILVGTAGTATTLAAISLKMDDYDYRLVNNHVLEISEIRRIYQLLSPLSSADRLKIPGLEAGREDLIIAGILIVLQTMERFGFEYMKVSDYGLLEGLLLADKISQ